MSPSDNGYRFSECTVSKLFLPFLWKGLYFMFLQYRTRNIVSTMTIVLKWKILISISLILEYRCMPDPWLLNNNTNVTYYGYALGSTALQTCQEGYYSNDSAVQNITFICTLKDDLSAPSLKSSSWTNLLSTSLICTGQSSCLHTSWNGLTVVFP